MNTLLKETARHYHGQPLRNTIFVLPTKRAAAALTRESAALGDNVRTIAVGDWEEKLRGGKASGRINLLVELYDVYKSLNPAAESLDRFIFWGGVLLSDFNAIDRYRIDARGILTSVTDRKGLTDETLSYLSETQKAAMERLADHLRGASVEDDDVKGRFVRVWEILYPLYTAFRERLRRKGMSYSGMAMRDLAERLSAGADIRSIVKGLFFAVDRFVVIGLNAIDECEKTLLTALRKAGMAEFVWDAAGTPLRDAENPASRFVLENMKLFPQAFPLEVPKTLPEVVSVSVPSSVGQAKTTSAFLKECGDFVPEETVFVLPDGSLLDPLLSSIPEEIRTINVTMGYPVGESASCALIREAGRLQTGARVSGTEVSFHHEAVWDILSSPLVDTVLSEEEKTGLDTLKAEKKPYLTADELSKSELTAKLFRLVLKDTLAADAAQNVALGDYLLEVMTAVGQAYAGSEGCDPRELICADRCCEALEEMASYRLDLLPSTWLGVLDGALRGESIPFEGVPSVGLQVMGTLETRAMDFRNIAILGANEGNFPKHDSDASFIPPQVRRVFGLPTPDFHDAVWAYHIYRLLQRAERVWFVHDSRVDGMNSGEETRYVKQLEYIYGMRVRHATAVAEATTPDGATDIEKTGEDIEALRNGHLSASSLQDYLQCPAKFYYGAVKRLEADEPVKESLDAAMLGTVFHRTMEHLYSGRKAVTDSYLRSVLADRDSLKETVEGFIREQTHSDRITGRDVITAEVIIRYVEAALRHDLSLLEKSKKREFRIIGLERMVKMEIEGFPFIGFIDRIDAYRNGEVRIVDYKTGHVENDDILITDGNAEAVAEKLFGESNTGRPKIALQLFLYDTFAREGIVRDEETVVNSIYSTSRLLTDPLPDVPESKEFREKAGEGLKKLLREIADTSVPWKHTCDRSICEYCGFRTICGR